MAKGLLCINADQYSTQYMVLRQMISVFLDPHFTGNSEVHSKGIKDLSGKGNTLKYLQENIYKKIRFTVKSLFLSISHTKAAFFLILKMHENKYSLSLSKGKQTNKQQSQNPAHK